VGLDRPGAQGLIPERRAADIREVELFALLVLAALGGSLVVLAARVLLDRVTERAVADKRASQQRWMADEWHELEAMLRRDGWSADRISRLRAEVFGS
jgi:hypothetical protein